MTSLPLAVVCSLVGSVPELLFVYSALLLLRLLPSTTLGKPTWCFTLPPGTPSFPETLYGMEVLEQAEVVMLQGGLSATRKPGKSWPPCIWCILLHANACFPSHILNCRLPSRD